MDTLEDDVGPDEARSEALDRALEGLATWSAEERSKYCDDLAENPLFMSKVTDGDMKTNMMLQALQNAEYDDIDTPQQLARESKQKGNDSFQRGPDWYPNAIKHYNDAIEHAMKATKEKKEMKKVLSTCYSNLAAIYLHRKKYITVLDCCDKALRYWSDNTKASFRAAKACIALGRASSALELCELGRLSDEAGGAAFDPLVKEASELLARQDRIAAATRKEAAARHAKLEAVRAGCRERGIRVGPPVFSGLTRTNAEPYIDEDGVMHWPILLLYPQYNQSDYLEDVGEVATIGDVLSHVFPESGAAPPAWDARREYTTSNLEVFFRSNVCKAIDHSEAWTREAEALEPEESWKTSRMIRVPHDAPLLLPLVQQEHVTADIPVFYVVPKSSRVYEEMKAKAGGNFVSLRVPDNMHLAAH